MDGNELLYKVLLPKEIQTYFDVKELLLCEKSIEIQLEEKNEIPEGYDSNLYESKGFHKEITVQDFPLRGKAVYLKIKRRRWRNKETGQVIERDWKLVAQGTRITKEFADFLKGINREQNRLDK